MAEDERSCCRWTVTILHLVSCVVSGFCILCIILMRDEVQGGCLPTLTDTKGNPMYYEDTFLNVFCSVILYAAGGIAGWNLFSLVGNCCWENKCFFALQSVVFVGLSILGLTGSASLTTQFLLWCRNLQAVFPGVNDCSAAAAAYDTHFNTSQNMTTYFRTDLIQQGCTWGVSFTNLMLAFIYISLLCIRTAKKDFRVIYVRDEEMPLIPNSPAVCHDA